MEFPPKDIKTQEQRHGSRQGTWMLMAFLLVSSWLPAQRKHADPSDRSTLPEQSHEENTYNIEEPEGTWRRKRGRTLGRLVLLQVALAGRLGLLAVAAAHGGWIRRRSMAATRPHLALLRPAAGPRRSALGLWFTGGEGGGWQISPMDLWAPNGSF